MRRQPPAKAAERPALSYLVRFWLEPGEEAGEPPPPRAYSRDLRTGEELYFGDPRRFAEHVLRQLRAARQEEAARSEADEVERMSG